jgi:diketogulonate reductase-like aldo/keto reductase
VIEQLSRKKLRVLENLEAANISLTREEVEAINKLLTDSQISGDRYFGEGVKDYVWG